jgi:tRNA threonylcarbamoyladenosine biosynthesis protein TsaE
MVTFTSSSPEQTIALGESWGREAAPGWLIGLTGELGAGKTQLVKGIAIGLGVSERVHSPTFAIVHEYRSGRLPLVHLDLYRLENCKQILAAGLEEYFGNREAVVVVEWIERWLEGVPDEEVRKLPGRFRRVVIEHAGEKERRIRYEDFGS